MGKIAVALSGGGYRASLFGLGTLLYLADVGKNQDVVSISSVSGGSITNAYVAQMKGYKNCTGEQFREGVKKLIQVITHKTLWSTPLVWAYLVFILLALIGVCLVWFLPWHWFTRLCLFLPLFFLWGWLIQQRGMVVSRAIRRTLYQPNGKPTKLQDIEKNIDHVICATHLQAGEHVYFSGRFIYSYRFGWTEPTDLQLHEAVQASAAFPGGFPPRWMRASHIGFRRQSKMHRTVTLVDGGVYDNMADQWPLGIKKRLKSRYLESKHVPDEIIAVNSSAGLAFNPVRCLRIPIVGELLTLLRDVGVMYDNSASLRSRILVDLFRSNRGPEGALVYIEQSPFKIPEKSILKGTGAQPERARKVLDLLPLDRHKWKRITKENKKVATTLSSLGAEKATRLLFHGYMLAMANLHVILDYPLPKTIPSIEDFGKLTAKD